MKNTISVVYFGGSVGICLNNELFTHKPYRDGGMEELFNRSLFSKLGSACEVRGF